MAIVIRTENLNRFFAEIRNLDTLSKYDEMELFAEYQNGNEKAKDAICNPNLKWVVSRAKAYTTDSDKVQDLIQEGAIGMLDAFSRYDPTKGVKFFTFANYYIDLYMRNFLFGNTMVRQTNDKKIAPLVRKIVREFYNLNMRNPNEYEIADILENAYEIKVKDLRDILSMEFSYIDGVISEGEDSHTYGESGEFAVTTASINEYEREVEKEGVAHEIKKYLCRLTPKEYSVIENAFGLNGKLAKEDEEIAEDMGLTKERVRQIRVGAIKKMAA